MVCFLWSLSNGFERKLNAPDGGGLVHASYCTSCTRATLEEWRSLFTAGLGQGVAIAMLALWQILSNSRGMAVDTPAVGSSLQRCRLCGCLGRRTALPRRFRSGVPSGITVQDKRRHRTGDRRRTACAGGTQRRSTDLVRRRLEPWWPQQRSLPTTQ